MKHILPIIVLFSLVACSTPAEADHSDNGKCTDEIKHLQTLEASADKSSSEYNQARELKSTGLGARLNGKEDRCEELLKQAIELID